MHLLDHYALNCGLKNSQAYITEDFFPNPHEKYLCINNEGAIDSLQYSYWTDVIEILSPYIKEKNIKILQIGKQKDQLIPGCLDYRNISSRHQAAYLIKRAAVFIGADTFYSMMADHLGTPSVLLYGSIPSSCIGPYWNKEKISVLCKQDPENFSFSAVESPKSINKIYPEEVAKEILFRLGMENSKIDQKTIHIGDLYGQKILECIPNFAPHESFAQNSTITLRLDEEFDVDNLIHWCIGRKINIVTNKEIDINVLLKIKNNVTIMHYEVGEDSRDEYFQAAKGAGIPITLFRTDEENINQFRLKFFDWGVEVLPKTKKPEDLSGNLFFQSGKLVFRNSKKYPSKFHAVNNIESEGIYHKVIDDPEFWEELDHFRIFEKKS